MKNSRLARELMVLFSSEKEVHIRSIALLNIVVLAIEIAKLSETNV